MVSVFLTSPGRCGSHWLGWMLRDALGLEKHTLVPQGTDVDGRWERLVGEVGEQGFHIQHPPLGYLRGISPRIVVLVRDPRDIAISMAYYALRRGTELRQLEIAWHLRDIPRSASEGEMLSYFKEYGFNLPWWKSYLAHAQHENRIPHIGNRYEDMVRDTDGVLRRILNLLGYPLPEKALLDIVRFRSFEWFSQGRERGTEDKSHHYRKGVAGDWMNHFTSAENARFCLKHERYMSYFGYGGYDDDSIT